MAQASSNMWVQELGLWVDLNTGNTMDPNEGFWRNPDRSMVFGGQFGDTWQAPGPGLGLSQASSAVNGNNALSLAQGQAKAQELASKITGQGTSSTSTTGGFTGAAAGYAGQNLEDDRAQETLIRNLISANNKEVANINKEMDLAISQGQIKQSEAEFSRKYLLDQRAQALSEELGRAKLELDKKAEARASAETGAKLAANPSDWIAYQYYTRQPGFVQSPGLPGAASDQQIQSTANGLFNPPAAAYNPNLKGTGAFGATIEAPNTISRAESSQMSSTQRDMLSGLVRAGVKGPNGEQVPISPEDYMGQVERSFVPTLTGGTNKVTQYA